YKRDVWRTIMEDDMNQIEYPPGGDVGILTEDELLFMCDDNRIWKTWKKVFTGADTRLIQVSLVHSDGSPRRSAQLRPGQRRDAAGLLTELLMERFRRRMRPITLLCVKTGQESAEPCLNARELRAQIEQTAVCWMEYGYCGSSFVDWLKREVLYED
ncbi:MAG: hypothetical protein LUE86_02515, partial [Clostridiales bacterium]|nr:hypothetical protein [Clostridiales bacterium]